MSQDFIDSVLDSFQDQPSNLTMMREYEKMAKTHMNRYFEVLGNKPREPKAIETGIVLLIYQLRAALYDFLLENCINKRSLNLFGLALFLLKSRPTKLKTTWLFQDKKKAYCHLFTNSLSK